MIRWRPEIFVDRIGFGRDPINFDVLNLDTGDLFTATFFDLMTDLGADTFIDWNNSQVQIGGQDGELRIEMDSPFITTGTGLLHLKFEGGIVTTADDSGLFDGLLPSLGSSSASIGFAFGGADGFIDIGFDFGTENTNGYNFNVGLGGGGMISEMGVVPEPASLALATAGLLACLAVAHAGRRGASSPRPSPPG